MKKCLSLFTLMLVCSIYVPAQKIKYESSLEAAKSLAAKLNKPVAILITIEPPVYTPNFTVGLNDKSVIEKFNNNFINFRADMADTAASAKAIRLYRIYKFPSLTFLDSKGGILFTDVAFLSMPNQLIELANKAIAASKQKSLADFDKEYVEGNTGTSFLKEYITRREHAGITANDDLIEKYVYGLKVADFSNYQEVLFILKAGPIVDGNAYKLSRLNKSLIDSIYKTEPLDDRKTINNAIISNSLAKAISEKNFSLAQAVANYTRGTWSDNPYEGQKAYAMKLIQYYSGIKDTTRYLQQASSYYEQYYMRLTVDSVRKQDSVNFVKARNAEFQRAIKNINNSSNTFTFSFAYSKDRFATELNNAAWTIYQMAGNRTEYLLKAMMWSRRSIELRQNPSFYDTYAHLLYKLQLFDEAESMEKKAIEYGIAGKIDTKRFETEYEKIKTRSLK